MDHIADHIVTNWIYMVRCVRMVSVSILIRSIRFILNLIGRVISAFKYDEFGCIIIRFMGVHISNFDELCRTRVISVKVTRACVEYDRSNDVCIESGEFGWSIILAGVADVCMYVCMYVCIGHDVFNDVSIEFW